MLKGLFSSFKSLLLPHPLTDTQKLILVATGVAGFLLFSANYFYDNDSVLLMSYANALLHGNKQLNSPAVARYDIAYPLLLILSGYPYHHSLIGVALINVIMAILMPVLMYITVRPVFPKGAYYIALVSIFSLSPFYYIKFARPDHAYMFFAVLSICLLSLFIYTKRPGFLYAMTSAVIVVSLLRAAGNILFPFFLVIAFLYGRGSWKKYTICALIGFSIFSLYSYHRHQFFSKFGGRASYNGGQTFQNLYVNSKEFGIRLSPELGPAMKVITDNLYQAVLPRPSLSPFIKSEGNGVESLTAYISEKEFLAAHIYPFSAEELINQIYKTPNWDYSYMLYIATPNDSLFFKASWEIIRRYPWYPFAFTARNMWHLLYYPGFEHSRYTVHRFNRTVIRDAFPYDALTEGTSNLTPRAERELNFDRFKHKPHFVKKAILRIKKTFCHSYLKFTRIIFYCMTIAWVAVAISLINRLVFSKKIQYVVDLLPKNFTPLVTALSLYLFLSMLIISVFVDPLLRFHNHLIPFKLMLAGLGVGIMLHAVRKIKRGAFPEIAAACDNLPDHQNVSHLKQRRIMALSLILMIVILFAGWGGYMWIHT